MTTLAFQFLEAGIMVILALFLVLTLPSNSPLANSVTSTFTQSNHLALPPSLVLNLNYYRLIGFPAPTLTPLQLIFRKGAGAVLSKCKSECITVLLKNFPSYSGEKPKSFQLPLRLSRTWPTPLTSDLISLPLPSHAASVASQMGQAHFDLRTLHTCRSLNSLLPFTLTACSLPFLWFVSKCLCVNENFSELPNPFTFIYPPTHTVTPFSLCTYYLLTHNLLFVGFFH